MVKAFTFICVMCLISLLHTGCKDKSPAMHYFELTAANEVELAPNGNCIVGWIRASSDKEHKNVQIIPVEMDEDYLYWVQWKLEKLDINFDGYTDIGVRRHGGAKWGKLFFWLYDPKTKQFYRNSLTEQIGKLSPNHFWTDPNTKQIKITEFYGATLTEYSYKFDNGQLQQVDSSLILLNGEEVRPWPAIPETRIYPDPLPPNIDTCPVLYKQGS